MILNKISFEIDIALTSRSELASRYLRISWFPFSTEICNAVL